MDIEYIKSLFLNYVQINSRSDSQSTSTPTTAGQTKLARLIAKDLEKLQLSEVKINPENGYVTARLAGNTAKKVDPIGFIAHLDTANFIAENVKPIVHPNYNGGDIVLPGATIQVSQFPEMKQLKGQTVITSDGTTLLGTDDKAGIVEIIGAIKYLLDHPEIPHGDVKIGFGPDEEIGRGAKRFDAEDFGTRFAYTLDNGRPGDLEVETFNGAKAEIEISGTAVHPGNAYKTLVNAITIANRVLSQLPVDDVPEKSQGRQGFFLVDAIEGAVDHAKIDLIIRDFDDEQFKNRKIELKKIIEKLNSTLDYSRITLRIIDQYHNIGTEIKKHPEITQLALKVYQQMGLKPNIVPFRGGTDGNFITEKGIPTPNLFNGGGNYHGPYEYITVEEMALAAQVVVGCIKNWADYNTNSNAFSNHQ